MMRLKKGQKLITMIRMGHALTSSNGWYFAYAKSKKVGVIPTISSPGHMDATEEPWNTGHRTHDHLQLKSPAWTVDLDKPKSLRLYQSLADWHGYFSGKVMTFSHWFDEYANDATDAHGWQVLQASKHWPGEGGPEKGYEKLSNMLMWSSSHCEKHKMKPMAFNDGIYYNSDTSYGTLTRISLCPSRQVAGMWLWCRFFKTLSELGHHS